MPPCRPMHIHRTSLARNPQSKSITASPTLGQVYAANSAATSATWGHQCLQKPICLAPQAITHSRAVTACMAGRGVHAAAFDAGSLTFYPYTTCHSARTQLCAMEQRSLPAQHGCLITATPSADSLRCCVSLAAMKTTPRTPPVLSTRNSSSVVIHMLGCLRRMLVTACTERVGSGRKEGFSQECCVSYQTCIE